MYDGKVYGQNLIAGDRILMTNVSNGGGTGKVLNF